VSTRPVIADMLSDAQELLDGGVDGLTALLDEVASYGEQPVPAPSPELAMLLAGRPAARPARPQGPTVPVRLRARRAMAGLAAAAVSGLSLTGAAAVANELPVPMQRAVAHISEQHLPFSFPRPVGDPPAPGGWVGTAPGQDGAGQDGAGTDGTGTDAAPDQAETGTAKTGQGGHGGESRPTRTSGSPTGKTGKTGSTGAAVGGGEAKATRTTHPEALRGAGDDPAEPRSGAKSESNKPDMPRGHAHAGSGSSGQGTKATPPRPAHAPKGGGSVPDATKVPNSAQDPTGASAPSSRAHPAEPDADKVRVGGASTEDGSGADSS
jgi:hypothetical protein